jgi:hypothetical protein
VFEEKVKEEESLTLLLWVELEEERRVGVVRVEREDAI